MGEREMKLKKEIMLSTGEELLLRSLTPQDAQEAIRVCTKAAGETLNLSRYADEWRITLDEEQVYIYRMENGSKSLMIGAFMRGRMVGIASFAPPAPTDRARHRANLGITILKSHWGMGVGTAMMRAMIDAAKTTALEQLELDVVSTNEKAIRLYERCGFEEYGRHPRMMKYRDGTYADMILMMLDLRK